MSDVPAEGPATAEGRALLGFLDGYGGRPYAEAAILAIEQQARQAALDDLGGTKVYFTADDIRAAKASLGHAGDKAEAIMFVCADIVAAILDRLSGSRP